MRSELEIIAEAARRDPQSSWYPVVDAAKVRFAEEHLNIELPPLLKDVYLNLSNGGIGPGYKIGGLPGGNECAWGDIIQSTMEIRRHDDSEEGWLPIVDWGCNQVTMIDCDDNFAIVTWLEGDVRHEDRDFSSFLLSWASGLDYDIETGEFVPVHD